MDTNTLETLFEYENQHKEAATKQAKEIEKEIRSESIKAHPLAKLGTFFKKYDIEEAYRSIIEEWITVSQTKPYPTVYIHCKGHGTYICNKDKPTTFTKGNASPGKPIFTKEHFYDTVLLNLEISAFWHTLKLKYVFGPLQSGAVIHNLLYKDGKWKLGKVIRMHRIS